ncbi:MAG: zinc ribbon domain-containing protein [Thermoplasmata archaeon]
MSKRGMRGFALVSLVLLLLLPAPSSAQSFSLSVLSDPPEVEKGSELRLTINVTNHSNQTYQSLVVVALVYPDGGSPQSGIQLQPDQRLSNLGKGETKNVTFTYKATSPGRFSVVVKLYNRSVESPNWLYEASFPSVLTVKCPPQTGDGGIPLALVAAMFVAAALVGAGSGLFYARRKKARTVEAKAAPSSARPPEPVKPRGKVPRDYYKFRREKYSRLKPIGLTSSGVTILGNVTKKKEKEPSAPPDARSACCPRCGIEMDPHWKVCKRCLANDTIRDATDRLGELVRAGGNGTGLDCLLQSAQAELEAGNYDDARTYALDVLDRAKQQLTKVEETGVSSAPPRETSEDGLEGEGSVCAGGAAPGENGGGDAASEAGGQAAPAPPKRVPNPCVKCGEGLKAEWRKCPYCGAVQDGVCSSCGRVVKLRWGTCPHCGVDLSETKPRVTCSVCGTELPEAGECLACKAKALFESASRLVKEVKGKGADVSEAEAYLGRGELAIRLKSYDKAISHFQRAEELARTARREFWLARVREKLMRAEAALREASERGAETAEADELLSKARAALAAERFKEAETYAELSAQSAQEAAARPGEGEGRGPQIHPVRPSVVGERCPACGASVRAGENQCPACGRGL